MIQHLVALSTVLVLAWLTRSRRNEVLQFYHFFLLALAFALVLTIGSRP